MSDANRTTFEMVIGDHAATVSGEIEGVGDRRIDCRLAVEGEASGVLCASIAVSEDEAVYAVVCDHRVDPPQPGLVRSRWLSSGTELDVGSLDDLEAQDLEPTWRLLLEAIASGNSEVPATDAIFPGPFGVEAQPVEGDLGAATFVAKYPFPVGHPETNWSEDCPIRVVTRLDGHHLVWTVEDTDTVPGEGSGYMTGWATFARGVGLTTFRDMDFANPPFLCFAASVPPDDPAELAAWTVAWGYAALTVGDISPDTSAGRSVA